MPYGIPYQSTRRSGRNVDFLRNLCVEFGCQSVAHIQSACRNYMYSSIDPSLHCLRRSIFTKNYNKNYYGMSKYFHQPFFLTLNCASETVPNATGSSVTNRTRSLDTVAKRRRSVNSNAQYGLTARPSTLESSPPKIHCLPAVLSTNGWNTDYVN